MRVVDNRLDELASSPGEPAASRSAAGATLEGELGPEAFRAIFEQSPDGVLFTIPDGRVIAANPAACEILGRTEHEIRALGRQGMADVTDERWAPMLQERSERGVARGIARMIRGDGAVVEIEMSARIFTDPGGEERVCTIFRDVTERVAVERRLAQLTSELRELSLTDELTGLNNRRGFVAVCTQLVEVADRQRADVWLLFLDVDNLKAINDDLGHPAGDAALVAVAGALRAVMRRADAAARIGGDEFVALALGLAGDDRRGIVERIQEFLSRPATVEDVGRAVQVSAGWASRRAGDGASVQDLLVGADREMYRRKGREVSRARTGDGRDGDDGRDGRDGDDGS
jgi:diguanylate cyclase (GGDEF)-like protein/PAS domain S-box-containing protein